MRMIILGPPGAGKGTEAKFLAKKFNLKHISPGAFLREEYKHQTPLGLKAYTYWSKGNLVPDKIIISITMKRLPKNNYILDGYPRTLYEATYLEKKQKTDIVIYLTCTKKTIIKRLLNRAKIEGRKDDTLEVINQRIKVYAERTAPILHHYRKKIITVDGNGNKKQVLKNILDAIARHKNL